MTSPNVKTIRALERGLKVIAVLQEAGAQSLDELHCRCELPKATLSRILKTLNEQGWVERRLADGRWYGNSVRLMRETSANAPHSRLAQASAPILAGLCQRLIWPSDLSVRVGTHMELTETSRAYSHLALTRITIGFPVNMLLSAPGRAYLAFCPKSESDEIVTELKSKTSHSAALAKNRKFLSRLFRETRERGFGARDPNWGGHISLPQSKYDDGLNAIAVPILLDDRVLGCINIVWIRKLVDQDEMARRHLMDMQDAAREIADAYEA